GLSTHALIDARTELLNQGFFIAALAIFITTITLIAAINWMLHGLKALAQTTREIAAGNFDVPITIQSSNEIGQLADDFREMRAALRQRTATLHASEEQLRLVMQGTNDGVWDWDIITKKAYTSRRWLEIIGFSADEFPDAESILFDNIHPDDHAAVVAAMRSHLENGVAFQMEYRIRRRDAVERWVLSRGEAVRDADGVAVRMVGSLGDISKRKFAEAELQRHREHLKELVFERTAALEAAKDEAERANRAKSDFLGRMSHELRTPMNAIMGFAQILELEANAPELKEYAFEIQLASDHLLHLINDLLDLSRIESGKFALVIQAASVKNAVQEVVRMVQPLAQKKGVTIRVECPEHQVLADDVRLKQILVNLLSNAIKYNKNEGRVTVGCEALLNHKLRIFVEDTGPGIAAEKLTLLFNPFERLGAEYTSTEGAGIGLAVSKQLADLMSCALTVTSSEGIGSVFSLTLPMAPSAAREDALAGDTLSATDPTQATVLYVEDNAANLRVVEAVLRRQQNYRFISANDGVSGLALACRCKPDVILLDINLPDMDGFAVLAALQDKIATRKIPVIAVSAAAMPVEIERALDAGFNAYVTKPIKIETLMGALGDALKVARARSEIRS
ncbi:MAG: response regulator, partial [Gammaproteobacteria bacterium]|nr:response regulator [Gammaproteobacteria bacterium]